MKQPSPLEPVSELRRVKIIENGEPLVDFLKENPDLQLDRPRFNYRRETMLRQTVFEAISSANAFLRSKGFHLRVVEGWRPPFIQRRMYRWSYSRFKELHPDWSDLRLTRLTNQFTAPMNKRVPPPHTTGGAVDLSLYRGDVAVDMVAPYAPRDHRGFVATAKLDPEARFHRDLLAEAFASTPVTNYPSEYWHWSYGDQGWAYRGGHPHAVYGPVEPPAWQPSLEDDTDLPLVYQE